MDRAAIKALATAMLQNRTGIDPLYFDTIIDAVYSHALVDAVPSMARRGSAVISTTSPTLIYELPDSWRALDSDYAYFGTTPQRIPVYTAQDAWLQQQVPANQTAQPTRCLLYGDESKWFVEFDAVPAASIDITLPGTFYRAALATEGVANANEALAVVYGTVLHIAAMQSLSDIVADAQRGMTTQLAMLRSQMASERQTNTAVPPAKDF